jgi:hypothetical protein
MVAIYQRIQNFSNDRLKHAGAAKENAMQELERYIRTIKDFPKPGIGFGDIDAAEGAAGLCSSRRSDGRAF